MSRSAQPTLFNVLTGEIKAESAKALLIECTGIDGNPWDPEIPCKHWVPYSQISRIIKQPDDSGLSDSVTVNRWILQQKGIV